MTSNADECVDILHKLFSTINNSVNDIIPITEGELLEAGKDVLKLKKIVDTLEDEKRELLNKLIESRVLIFELQQNKYIKNIMKEKNPRRKWTDGEKLKSGLYKRCKFCDSVLAICCKGEIDKTHYNRKKCKNISMAKLMVKKKDLFTENRKDGAVILMNHIGNRNTIGNYIYEYTKFLRVTEAYDMPHYKWVELNSLVEKIKSILFIKY